MMYSIEIKAITEIDQRQIDEIMALNAQIPEFDSGYQKQEFERRLTGNACLLLLAFVEGELAGFKLGYALDEQCFYSWLGGVLPDYRSLGLARSMLEAQERWATQAGYKQIQVKTRNQFRSMLNMLISHQYQVVDFRAEPGHIADNRLYLEKSMY
ncbi:GNAT family N-acetyltransferase [Shewanella algae]|uniref:GNAT family N-acetyltransferase n=1 Tax=Shewanella algae TaxID=38313 RepID=UPI0031F4AFE2